MSKTEIQLADTGIFEPTMSVDAAVTAFKQVQEINKKILTKEDYAMIKVNRKQPDGSWKTEENPFRKKSGSDKLSCFWGISTETSKTERIILENGSYLWKVTVRCFKNLPNGTQYSKERTAIVTSAEKDKTEKMAASPRKEHDVMSSAETRAYGRGISSFLGLSEPTAEEVEGGIVDAGHEESLPTGTTRACKCGPGATYKNGKCTNCSGKKI